MIFFSEDILYIYIHIEEYIHIYYRAYIYILYIYDIRRYVDFDIALSSLLLSSLSQLFAIKKR